MGDFNPGLAIGEKGLRREHTYIFVLRERALEPPHPRGTNSRTLARTSNDSQCVGTPARTKVVRRLFAARCPYLSPGLHTELSAGRKTGYSKGRVKPAAAICAFPIAGFSDFGGDHRQAHRHAPPWCKKLRSPLDSLSVASNHRLGQAARLACQIKFNGWVHMENIHAGYARLTCSSEALTLRGVIVRDGPPNSLCQATCIDSHLDPDTYLGG
ncbi:hypothetical protein PYCCODRAFT_942896 [Trametes coccinea BRFM310]|uniref:Uncharacterized protein n=1 Tax=Trametes coccinea (strain BRFM310) TaxID=1353009 RepID=A0A1Y2IZG8_TRAC3|nr:hypothetical protein PYCCODRAFT_942896 [Trametes coccinea BRFM310]